MEASRDRARAPASIYPSNALKPSLSNAPEILPLLRSSLALVRRRQAVIRGQLSIPSAAARPWLVNGRASLRPLRTWCSTHLIGRANSSPCACWGTLSGFPRQSRRPPAFHYATEGDRLPFGRSAHGEDHLLIYPYRHRFSTDQWHLNRVR